MGIKTSHALTARRHENVDERSGGPVVAKDLIDAKIADIEVPVWSKDRGERSGEPTAAGRYKGVDELPGGAVVAENLRGEAAADVQVLVGSVGHATGDGQPTAPLRDEDVHELAGGRVVSEDPVVHTDLQYVTHQQGPFGVANGR